MTEDGTATAGVLLAREILTPLLGAVAERPTIQLSLPEPASEPLPQVNCFNETEAALLPEGLYFTPQPAIRSNPQQRKAASQLTRR